MSVCKMKNNLKKTLKKAKANLADSFSHSSPYLLTLFKETKCLFLSFFSKKKKKTSFLFYLMC